MNPKQKLEQTAKAYLDSLSLTFQGSALNIYKGIENTVAIDDSPDAPPEPRIVPCGTVAVEADLTEAIPFTGNWEGDLTVAVEADAQNLTDADFDTLCATVFDPFNSDESKSLLQAAAPGFTCLFLNVAGSTGKITQGNNWASAIRVHVVFCQTRMF